MDKKNKIYFIFLFHFTEPPSQVQFEAPLRPSSGGSRSGSAGRIEKKLQVLKKKVEGQAELRNINSADGRISRTKQPTG